LREPERKGLTHLEGPLYRACTSERRLWRLVEITANPDDPRRSTRVTADWARTQIEKYGRDNPWVLVNVFGRFPPQSLDTLIGPDECAEATKRAYGPEEIATAPRILGVDVASFGDDSSVIFPRQDLVAFAPIKVCNVDGTQGAGLVARKWQDWAADACFVDDTGGSGSSWIDNLQRLGHQPIGIAFSGRASDPRYDNKRTDQVKARLGYSPDDADAFTLTFAQPVAPRGGMPGRGRPGRVLVDDDPLARRRW
jgi:phage terminase large subunit